MRTSSTHIAKLMDDPIRLSRTAAREDGKTSCPCAYTNNNNQVDRPEHVLEVIQLVRMSSGALESLLRNSSPAAILRQNAILLAAMDTGSIIHRWTKSVTDRERQ